MPQETSVDPVRIGVIGCADIARRQMLPALTANDDVRVVAVAGRDPAKTARFARWFGCEAVDGYDRLLDRTDLDAVYVPLPAMLHAPWVEKALLSGRHVLVEKPLTATHEDTERLARLARAKDLALFENFMFLHHSQHRRIAELLSDGVIGELRAFSATFTIPPKPADDIRYLADIGGGALLDIGVHPVRAALHFLGSELEVAGAVLRRDPDRRVDLAGMALLHTPEGVLGRIHFGMEHSYRSGYVLSGSEGRIELDRAFTPPPHHQPVVRIERQNHREELVLPPDHQFANVTRAFVTAVREGEGRHVHAALSSRQAALVSRIRARAGTVDVHPKE
ncbi:Gfo/Idh/MocA family protein [Streptomyces sp. NPDC058335]|uniref:Gfo/Idh/MocA family protein n=1 Tax=Streptomyces sp. NPDC058335 TaxID=3346451 RepID=UPI00365BB06D